MAIVLTDNNNRTTSQIILTNNYVCIPTPHGRNSVSVYTIKPGETLDSATASKAPTAQFIDDSDYSFIIRMEGAHIQIVRSVYGNIYQEATGLR